MIELACIHLQSTQFTFGGEVVLGIDFRDLFNLLLYLKYVWTSLLDLSAIDGIFWLLGLKIDEVSTKPMCHMSSFFLSVGRSHHPFPIRVHITYIVFCHRNFHTYFHLSPIFKCI
jgi:hypothetical protein